MNNALRKLRRAALAAFFVSASAVHSAPMATDPMADDVLALMSDAYRELAWHGTLMYSKGNQMVSLKVHRDIVAGQPVERLERLSGDNVKLMRQGNWLLGLYPGQEILKQGYSVPTANVPPLGERLQHIKQNYSLSVMDLQRVAGRTAIPIKLTANDNLRFHRVFWCDQETGLLLRSQIRDGSGVLEQFEFVDVQLSPVSNEAAMVVDAQGMEVHRHPLVPSQVSQLAGFGELPPGFMPLHQSKLDNGSVSQLIGDGVSLVSLFYERIDGESHVLNASDGPTHAYSKTLPMGEQWLRVTGVGEVPTLTLMSLIDQVDVIQIQSLLESP